MVEVPGLFETTVLPLTCRTAVSDERYEGVVDVVFVVFLARVYAFGGLLIYCCRRCWYLSIVVVARPMVVAPRDRMKGLELSVSLDCFCIILGREVMGTTRGRLVFRVL